MDSLWFAFLTGLTTGGISCFAVQGGLLATAVASGDQPENSGAQPLWTRTTVIYPLLFVVAKLIGYTVLGFVLGWIGSFITLSLVHQAVIQIIAGVIMLLTAARIADIHPIFRYFAIQPPKFVYRRLRMVSKEPGMITPVVLGASTVFLPCGVTQAMMVAAVATGNPVMGALTMLAFTIGTSPLFFLFGIAAAQLLRKRLLAYAAAVLVAYFGVMSVNGGVALTGSPYTLQNFYRAATVREETPAALQAAPQEAGQQKATVYVASSGYTTDVSALKVGVPVSLSLVTNGTQGCARAFTIPSLNISKILPETGTEVVTFTPTKTGTLSFACNMGMYTGSFAVIP